MKLIRYGIRRKSTNTLLGYEFYSFNTEFGIENEFHLDEHEKETPWMVDSKQYAEEVINKKSCFSTYHRPSHSYDPSDLEVVKLTIQLSDS